MLLTLCGVENSSCIRESNVFIIYTDSVFLIDCKYAVCKHHSEPQLRSLALVYPLNLYSCSQYYMLKGG